MLKQQQQQQPGRGATAAATHLHVASKEGVSDSTLHFGVEQRADVVCLLTRNKSHTAVRAQLRVTARKNRGGKLTSTFMKLMFGVKVRVTLVLYALSLLFLMLMSTSILSFLDLMSILKATELQVKAPCNAHILPLGRGLAPVYGKEQNQVVALCYSSQEEKTRLQIDALQAMLWV